MILVALALAGGLLAAGRPADLEALAGAARSLPAEFAADALIRIAGSDRAGDPSWRRELLEDAFRLSVNAQEPFKQAGEISSKSREGFAARAFSQDLDALSLQLRAVRELLRLDKRGARELFTQIPPLRLEPRECADSLAVDVSLYYETLAAIVRGTFSPKEVREQEPIKFAAPYLAALHSPLQVAPMAKAIVAMKLAAGEQDLLVNVFAGALRELAAGDRSFAAASPAISANGDAWLALLRQSGSPALADAVRRYLARNLKGSRCADPALDQAVDFFNSKLRDGTELPEITADEIRGERAGGTVTQHTYWKSGRGRQLLDLFGRVNADKESLKQFESDLISWKPGDDDPLDHFNQKCLLMSNLINTVSDEATRVGLIRQLASFLETSDVQRDHRLQWFLAAGNLLSRVLLDPVALGPVGEELRNSPNPVIAFAAALEKACPGSKNVSEPPLHVPEEQPAGNEHAR